MMMSQRSRYLFVPSGDGYLLPYGSDRAKTTRMVRVIILPIEHALLSLHEFEGEGEIKHIPREQEARAESLTERG